jgi:hypothetical protein
LLFCLPLDLSIELVLIWLCHPENSLVVPILQVVLGPRSRDIDRRVIPEVFHVVPDYYLGQLWVEINVSVIVVCKQRLEDEVALNPIVGVDFDSKLWVVLIEFETVWTREWFAFGVVLSREGRALAG